MSLSAEEAWAPGPLHPQLADGAVHVWRADLAVVSEELEGLLSREERARAARLLNEQRGELWRRSRGLLRALLGRYLRCDGSSLRFAFGAYGKPALVQDGDHRLSFNTSHSGSIALCGLSRVGEIGVDVEVARRTIDEVAVARRTLGEVAARRLERLDPDRRRSEFLRGWCRHEAALKCLGVGIGAIVDDVRVQQLWLAELELGSGDAAAAVAAERPASELCCWEWPS